MLPEEESAGNQTDISHGRGPMISEAVVREFMLPYYRRFTAFLKGKGIKYIFVDTDGYC